MVNEQNAAMDHKLTNESEHADGAQTTPTIFLDSKAHTYTLPADVVAVPEKAFDKASRLAEILVDEKSAHFRSVDGVLFDAELKTLVRYPRKKHGPLYTVPDSVVAFAAGAFYGCGLLRSITLPTARLDRRRAFAKCACSTNSVARQPRRRRVGAPFVRRCAPSTRPGRIEVTLDRRGGSSIKPRTAIFYPPTKRASPMRFGEASSILPGSFKPEILFRRSNSQQHDGYRALLNEEFSAEAFDCAPSHRP